MEPDWLRLGTAVREGRVARGLTQAGLGDRVGVGETTIANVENGRIKSVTPTMHAIGREFDWPPNAIDDLLHGGPAPAVMPTEDASGSPPVEGEGVPYRLARALTRGRTLDGAIIPLGPNSEMVVVVKGRPGATPEQLTAELLAWEREGGYLERIGEVAEDPSQQPDQQ